MKRLTKKVCYINGLNFDLATCNERLADGQPFFSLLHGERRSKYWFEQEKHEILKELEKIANDKNYKPWTNN